MKLVHVPNPILNKPCEPVTAFKASLVKIVVDMEEVLLEQVGPNLVGVGLAAPQVGLNKRLFIIKPSPKSETQVFANAEILKKIEQKPAKKSLKKKKKKGTKLEGCLSIPHLWGPLRRSAKVYVRYQDIDGNLHEEWFTGFKAVIIQHEVDHTNGILFTQRVLEQKGTLYEEKDGELKKLEY